jgi:cytochrome c
MRATRFLVLLTAFAALPASAQDVPPPDGEQLFQLVCAMCHSVNPPAKSAPPISHAAAYYIRRHEDQTRALSAMVTFLREPSAETSAMPPHAVERFGLMPPQSHLTEDQLRAVALYSLSLADTVHVTGRPHRERGNPGGNGSSGGMQRR